MRHDIQISRIRRVIAAAGVSLVIAAGLGGCSFLPIGDIVGGSTNAPQQQTQQASFTYSSNLSPDKYTLKEPALNLPAKSHLTMQLDDGVDLGLTTDGSDGTLKPYDVAMVYTDSALTHEYPCTVEQAITEDGKNVISVTPNGTAASDESNMGSDLMYPYSVDGKTVDTGAWHGAGGYYLVRYVGENGDKLDKPEVRYFTVEDDVAGCDNPIPAPDAPENVTMSVSENGGLDVSWAPVDGASCYRVYMTMTDTSAGTPSDRWSVMLLADTDDTEINTRDYDATSNMLDEKSKEDAEQYGDADISISQNSQFQQVVKGDTEDDIFHNRNNKKSGLLQAGASTSQLTDYSPSSDNVKDVSIAVVAVGEDGTQSQIKWNSANDMLGMIPVETASSTDRYFMEDAPDEDKDPVGYLKTRLVRYVTMADGTSAAMLATPDYDSLTKDTDTVIGGDQDNEVGEHEVEFFVMDYSIEGTTLRWQLSVPTEAWDGDENQFTDDVKKAIDELKSEYPQNGVPQRPSASDIDWEQLQMDSEPATDFADVPYDVYGSSDYVKYVASNLIAGRTVIDVTQYADQIGAPDITDVVEEAVNQNPIILYIPEFTSVVTQRTDDGKLIAYVIDGAHGIISDITKADDLRKQVDDAASSIIGDIITDGMSDTDKVNAINKWICDNFNYDYDLLWAFDQGGLAESMSMEISDAQNAATLVSDDHLAICSGYASSFNLLARKAGIDSIYVTGTVPVTSSSGNNGHAWNLVNVDGTWKLVDTTWDDTCGRFDMYMLLDQNNELLDGRMSRKDFMSDNAVTNYVDASKVIN